MVSCPSCGADVSAEAVICPQCGAAVGDAETHAYLGRMREVRQTIARQSVSLRQIGNLAQDPAAASFVRDQIASSVQVLNQIDPPQRYHAAHSEFLSGTSMLLNCFDALLEIATRPDPVRAEAIKAELASSMRQIKHGIELLGTVAETQSGTAVQSELVSTIAARADRPRPSRIPDEPKRLPLVVPPDPDDEERAVRDSWAQKRANLFAQIDNIFEQTVGETFRQSADQRRQTMAAVSDEIQRLTAERDQLRNDVHALRRNIAELDDQVEQAQRTLADLQSKRDAAEQARQSILNEAEARRTIVLRDVESISQELSGMRQRIVQLLGTNPDADSLPANLTTLRPKLTNDAFVPPRRADTPANPSPPRPVDEPARSSLRDLAASNAFPELLADDGRGGFDDLATFETENLPTKRNASAVSPSDDALEFEFSEPPTFEPLPDWNAPAPAALQPGSSSTTDLPELDLDAFDEPELPTEPVSTSLKISRLGNLAEGMQIRKAIKVLPGVVSLSFPQFKNGTMTMTVRHERGGELADDLVSLPGMKLEVVNNGIPETLELEALS